MLGLKYFFFKFDNESQLTKYPKASLGAETGTILFAYDYLSVFEIWFWYSRSYVCLRTSMVSAAICTATLC